MLDLRISDDEKAFFTQKIMEDLNKRYFEIHGKQAHADKALRIVIIINYIVENISEKITLEDLENISGKSRLEICQIFKLFYDITPIKWIWKVRLTLANEFIHLAPEWSLTDISYACGFSSLPHFSRRFSKAYNEKPLKLKQHVRKSTGQKVKKDSCYYDFIFGMQRNSFSRNILLNNINSLHQ
jgi:transcriptional regulator GlxA family with amidase domain